MADAQRPETHGNPIAGSQRPPGVPRWVKVSGMLVVILLLVLLVAKLAGGDHGPGRHGTGGLVGLPSDSGAVATAVTQPEGITRW